MIVARRTRRLLMSVAAGAAVAALLVGCAGAQATRSGLAINIGAVGGAPVLDPAGTSDQLSLTLQSALFSRLFTMEPSTGRLEPDLAESFSITSPTELTVRLRPGQRFANGDELSSADVKFSLERQRAIKTSGFSSDLVGLASISTPDADTIVLHLSSSAQSFAPVLAAPVATIVDQQVFSATGITPNDVIVRGEAFDGQYRVDSYHARLITLEPNGHYRGPAGAPRASQIALKVYAQSGDAWGDLRSGALDVAFGLSARDVASARTDEGMHVSGAAGPTTRFLVFDLNSMPFGATQPDADARKSLAVRQAVAELIDRKALGETAYSGTSLPLYSVVPRGQIGARAAFQTAYGNQQGGPDVEGARSVLDRAGVPVPVTMTLHFTPSQFGEQAVGEFKQLRDQLENGGLFTIKLGSSPFPQFVTDARADKYSAYQDVRVSDISDAGLSLSAFAPGGPLANHFTDDAVDSEIAQLASEFDAGTREDLIQDIQLRISAAVPAIPLLQDELIAVASTKVSGVTVDPRFGLAFGKLRWSSR